MTAPDEFLLKCISSDPLDPDGATLSAFDDWTNLLRLAAMERVGPLLFHRLKARELGGRVPLEVMRKLKETHRNNALRNLRLFGELQRITNSLRGDNVPVIALKGIHLAATRYSNIALREMNDIDLLVHPKDVAKAADAMTTLGYRSITAYSIDSAMATAKHLPPFVKAMTAAVEIHWNITNPGQPDSIEVGELWGRAVPLAIPRTEILGLSSEDLLLHLCHHASYGHRFQFGLRPFCDISELVCVRSSDLNWEQVVRRAERWCWQRGVYVILRLAKDLAQAAVPNQVLAALKPVDFDETIVETVKVQLFTDKAVMASVNPSLARIRCGHEPFWKKMALIIKRLFPPKHVIASLYPCSPDSLRIYFYYPVHIRNVAIRNGRSAMRLLRSDQQTVQIAQRMIALSNWLSDSHSK